MGGRMAEQEGIRSTDNKRKYLIQPYHTNGLNWRLTPEEPRQNNIVVVSGFNPSWWTNEYGIMFGREFHLDPQVHRATLVRMKSLLQSRFGDLPGFDSGPDYENVHLMERRYGDALVTVLFGCEVSFDDASGHPFAAELNLDDDAVLRLVVPDVANHPIIQRLFSDGPESGKAIVGELGFEGVINIAYKLRGMRLFEDMIDRPKLARHLFEVVWQTLDDLVHLIRHKQDPESHRPTWFVNCTCMANMISGRMYREQLLEFDHRFRAGFDLFGVHTCNWTVDPYLDGLSELPDLAYLDMGADSNLGRVHRLFPNLDLSVFFHPERLRSLHERNVHKEITELGKRIGRGYILLSDLEVGTTDGQIRAAYEAAAKL